MLTAHHNQHHSQKSTIQTGAALLLLVVALSACAQPVTSPVSPTNEQQTTESGFLLRETDATPDPTQTLDPTLYPPTQAPTTLPPASPTPTPRAMPRLVSHGNGIWDVPALELIPPDDYDWVEWESDVILRLEPWDEWFLKGYYTVDVRAGETGAEFHPDDPDPLGAWNEVFSPDRTYKFVLEANEVKLIRVEDDSIISRAEIIVAYDRDDYFQQRWIVWADDNSGVAFVSAEGEFYVWRVDESDPRWITEVLEPEPEGDVVVWLRARYPIWAPDSQRLAVVALWEDRDCSVELMVVNLNRNPHITNTLELACNEWGELEWITNDIILLVDRFGRWYYDVNSGELVAWWEEDHYHSGDFQPESLSPDGRWLAMDRGIYEVMYQGASAATLVGRDYLMYDLSAGTSFTLLADAQNYLEFVGWEEKPTTLHLVSRPADEASISEPNVPFGLLAYNPIQRSFEILFDEAMQVEYGPDRQWAFVVFPSRDQNGSLGLDGGVWEVKTTNLYGQQRLMDGIIYRDPAEALSFFEPSLVLVSWSHDGSKVVFANERGQLFVMGLNGEKVKLTDRLFDDFQDWNAYAYLSWSPDDTYLMIEYAGDVWIVTIPDL